MNSGPGASDQPPSYPEAGGDDEHEDHDGGPGQRQSCVDPLAGRGQGTQERWNDPNRNVLLRTFGVCALHA